MRKRELMKGVAMFALSGALPLRAGARGLPAIPDTAGRRPLNLLFITVDDMDASMAGFMGNRAGLTPNLDALAATSHRFVNTRTVAPICMPSRQAFMTGLLPHRSGGTGFIPVRDGTPSLVTILQQAGYFAGASHKIDHMLPQASFPWDYVQQGKDRHPMIHAAGLRVAMMEAEAQNKPLFFQANINDPHRPFYGSAGAGRPDHGQQGPYRVERVVQPEEVVVPPHLDDLPAVRVELAQYATSVRRMDAAIGHILRTLEDSGMADRTAVVFCSDHGMPFPFAKATCYHHGTHTPVLLRWPGMGTPRVFEQRTTNLDLLPTLLDLFGAPHPAQLDGRSWMPLIRGETTQVPEFAITQVNQVSSGMTYPARAIQDDRYALIVSPWADGKLEMRLESMIGLTFPAMVEAATHDPAIAARVAQYVKGIPVAFYDLRTDPGQRRNLAKEARHKARIARMADALCADMARTQDPELKNVRTVLAGGTAVVPQDPERYRLRNGGD